MSGPSSTAESLEAILASIRRSLSEQSTGVLDDEAAAPAELLDDLDMPPLPRSVSRQLAGAGKETDPERSLDMPGPVAAEREPAAPMPFAPAPIELPADAAARIEIPAAPAASAEPPAPRAESGPAPAAVLVPPIAGAEASPGSRDPLWFLPRGEETRDTAPPGAAGASQKPVVDSPAAKPPAADPKPSRTGVVRGPLPPFFGSSAEVVKVEMVPEPVVSSVAKPSPPVAPIVPPRTYNGEALRSAGSDPASGWPRSGDGATNAPNGKASAIFGAPPAGPEARAAGTEGLPQPQALEIMVAELLRPMLRRWLDENMPRLVSAALKSELALMADRDRKKP
jgi:cell pole-organizing protein PopZ